MATACGIEPSHHHRQPASYLRPFLQYPVMATQSIAANRAYFDNMASTYSSEVIRYVTQELSAYLLEHRAEQLKDPNVALLDYACGPGDVSLAFAPFVKSTTGADVSPAMLRQFQQRSKTVLPDREDAAKTILIDNGKLPEDAGTFDLILVSCSFCILRVIFYLYLCRGLITFHSAHMLCAHLASSPFGFVLRGKSQLKQAFKTQPSF